MNTPAHLIVGATVFGRPGDTRVTVAAILGALLPDASLFVMAGWELFVRGTSSSVVFNTLYFSERWQSVFAIDNSIPLWLAGLALGIARRSRLMVAFTGAGLLHLVADFLLHHDDARRMFWPLTDWVFRSPVSYWDPQHYGQIAGPTEVVISFALCTMLWRRTQDKRIRALILLLALAEVVPGATSLAPAVKG